MQFLIGEGFGNFEITSALAVLLKTKNEICLKFKPTCTYVNKKMQFAMHTLHVQTCMHVTMFYNWEIFIQCRQCRQIIIVFCKTKFVVKNSEI